jgi:hypothetical protein
MNNANSRTRHERGTEAHCTLIKYIYIYLIGKDEGGSTGVGGTTEIISQTRLNPSR